MIEQEENEAMVDDDNVLQISKFKGFIKKAKAVVTRQHYEPTLFLETRSIMKLIGQTELIQQFLRLKQDHTHYEWVLEMQNGEFMGIKITAFNKNERES